MNRIYELKKKQAALQALNDYTIAHGFNLSMRLRAHLADLLDAMDEDLMLETAKLKGSIQ